MVWVSVGGESAVREKRGKERGFGVICSRKRDVRGVGVDGYVGLSYTVAGMAGRGTAMCSPLWALVHSRDTDHGDSKAIFRHRPGQIVKALLYMQFIP